MMKNPKEQKEYFEKIQGGRSEISKRLEEAAKKIEERNVEKKIAKMKSAEIVSEDNELIMMPHTEMATVGADIDNNFLVIVTPDTNWSDAYLKVCNPRKRHRYVC